MVLNLFILTKDTFQLLFKKEIKAFFWGKKFVDLEFVKIMSRASYTISKTSDFENVNFENLITELFRKEDVDKHKKVDKLNLTAKLDFFQRQLTEISSFAYRYDPKTGLKSNGFRSFLKVRMELSIFIVNF